MASEVKCAGCNQDIQIKDETYTVKRGVANKRKLWGTFHVPCFNRALNAPECVMEEISRTSAELLND